MASIERESSSLGDVMEANSEKVLQAIQRGITTRPRLRDSTGFTYAQLEIILHSLEFEDQVINHTETADGFPRYSVRAGGMMITDADQRSAAKKGVSLNGQKPRASAVLCGCGRPSNHGGRCAVRRAKARDFSRATPKPLQDGALPRTVSEVVSDAEECLNVPAEAVGEAILGADIVVAEEIEKVPETSPAGDDPAAVESGGYVTLDGWLRFNISVNIASSELATWSPVKIMDFFNAIARIVAAGS